MILQKEHSFFFNHVSLAPNEQIGLHQQAMWELSYMCVGSGMRLVGDMTEPFKNGEVVMIPPEIPHCCFFNHEDVDINGQISNISITFTDEFLNTCSAAFPELREYVSRLKEIHVAVKFDKHEAVSIASVMQSMCNQNDVERLVSMIRLLVLTSSADRARVVGTYTKADRDQERLNMIHTYVICNAARNISLDDVVRYVGMNRSAFCTFFKRVTGKTFVTYLNEYRVELACRLLEQKNIPVSEICYQVGFADIPYFNRTFKKIKGCSPSKYGSAIHFSDITNKTTNGRKF